MAGVKLTTVFQDGFSQKRLEYFMAGSWSPCRDAGNSFKELGGERVIFNKPTTNVQKKTTALL